MSMSTPSHGGWVLVDGEPNKADRNSLNALPYNHVVQLRVSTKVVTFATTQNMHWTVRASLFASAVLTALVLVMAPSAALGVQGAHAAEGKVTLEWLGHEFYRLTSPGGVVVLTSPWLDNPDGPVAPDELARTDFILVPNSHNDDMGNPIEVAAVSGATVVTPAPLGRWLIDNGLDQSQFHRAGIGDLFTLQNTRFKIGPSAHDNTLATGADGGPAASFFVTFENGFTVFFNGHSTLIGDLPIYAATYHPDLAILGLTEAAEFAQVARLMSTNNPNLKVVIPSHIRPGAPILTEARQEMDRLGLGTLLFMPELRTPYEY
jgi:L-ascorbate metabolism protein UlaG (beta-lactamase superfamily)